MAEEPLVSIVRGAPTTDELAALVGTLAGLTRGAAGAGAGDRAEPPRRSAWARSGRPRRDFPGPDAWRRSGLPS